MARLITAVAMNGIVHAPHLLLQVDGVPPPRLPDVARIQIDQEALDCVKRGLERVVSSPTGTGRLAQVFDVPAAGKTGTAQVPQGRPHAWFIGYAPVEHPKVSFAVFLEHGGKGGESAAVVVRDLLVTLHELEYL